MNKTQSEQDTIFEKIKKAIEQSMVEYRPINIEVSVDFQGWTQGKEYIVKFKTQK